MAGLTVTAIGNAGFVFEADGRCVAVDPYYPGGTNPHLVAYHGRMDLILVTHEHWDHCNPPGIAALLRAGDGRVVLPAPAAAKLADSVTPAAIMPLEPGLPGAAQALTVCGIPLLVFRTRHARAHNSYRFSLGGVTVFDDGDNERPDLLAAEEVGPVDLFLLSPWRGQGWEELMREVKPRQWLLIHMGEEDLAQHARGRYLPQFCRQPPAPVCALRPGQSMTITAACE